MADLAPGVLLTPEQLAELVLGTGGERKPRRDPPRRGKENKKTKAKRKQSKYNRRINRR